MNKKKFLIIAAILMIIVGLLRGLGGLLLIINGNNLQVEPPISASDLVSKLCGLGLIFVTLLFVYSSFLLLKYKNKKGWTLGWIAIIIFIAGGIINGYLLFGNPFVQDQIINVTASILIGINLLLGKKSLQ